jgi:hypothetical protein
MIFREFRQNMDIVQKEFDGTSLNGTIDRKGSFDHFPQ